MHVSMQGFVDNMEEWMAACDIVITKAGPGTIAESLIMGLPILLNGFVPCQEAGNVPYVVDNGVRPPHEKSSEQSMVKVVSSRNTLPVSFFAFPWPVWLLVLQARLADPGFVPCWKAGDIPYVVNNGVCCKSHHGPAHPAQWLHASSRG